MCNGDIEDMRRHARGCVVNVDGATCRPDSSWIECRGIRALRDLGSQRQLSRQIIKMPRWPAIPRSMACDNGCDRQAQERKTNFERGNETGVTEGWKRVVTDLETILRDGKTSFNLPHRGLSVQAAVLIQLRQPLSRRAGDGPDVTSSPSILMDKAVCV